MTQHPNARPAPRGRETMVSRIESGLGVAEAARQMGVSRQTASKRLRRGRSGEGLADRGSRPLRIARLTPPEAEERVREARRTMLLAPLGLAAATGVPARTCARIVARSGLPRLSDIDRVAVDDRSRVAYAELLPDERGGTCAASRGRDFNALLESEGVRHRYTRPCSPWQNGKAGRMNRTLAQQWQYARTYVGEAERASALPAFIERYNRERPHSACGAFRPCRASSA